jgi:hypothetical protein
MACKLALSPIRLRGPGESTARQQMIAVEPLP